MSKPRGLIELAHLLSKALEQKFALTDEEFEALKPTSLRCLSLARTTKG